MRRELLIAAKSIVVFTVLLGVIYPFAVTGVAQLTMKDRAKGSLIESKGRTVGSVLIGQSFAAGKRENGSEVSQAVADRYFQVRPSATDYNAAGTAFSNLGPSNKELADRLHTDLNNYLKRERRFFPTLRQSKVPSDAVMVSASSIDPHISPADARIQVVRVSTVRNLPKVRVLELIKRYTEGRGLGLFGEPGVNVLKLNLALDREKEQ